MDDSQKDLTKATWSVGSHNESRAEPMTAPRLREQRRPPSPPDRLPPRRGGRPSSQTASARPAGFVRLAGARRGLVGGLALPATVQAQSETLVTNLSNLFFSDVTANARLAQGFGTGNHSRGYRLDAVELRINQRSGSTWGLEVELVTANSSGLPGALVLTFVAGDIPSGTGNRRFEAPGGTTLDPNTTYFIRFRQSGGSGQDLAASTTSNLGQTGVDNWSIADNRYYYNGSNWVSTSNRAFKMAVHGEAVPPELSVGDAEGNEGEGMAFTVTLTEAAAAEVTATWTASIESGDTAVEADLRSKTTGTVSIVAGATTGTFTVPTVDDSTDEDDETFTVTLSGVSANAQLASDATATGTIIDDDGGPTPPTNFSVTPGNTQVALSWDAPSSSDVTGHEFRYKTGGSYPAAWTAIANSAAGGVNEASHTVPSLTNQVAYTFELHAVNASGNSAAAAAGPVTPTPGICDRTQQVHERIVAGLEGVDDCAAVTDADLEGLVSLEMSSQNIDSLKSGDFAGLTSLVFLGLGSNRLITLPGTVFSGLTALRGLDLSNNALSSLPGGLFSGLTALTTLSLNGNFTNPMELTVTVERVGTDQARAKVLAGAPFAVDFPVTLVDGTLAGSVTMLRVAAGAVEGTAVTVTRTAGTAAAVTVDVDLTTQPMLPLSHTGYIFKKATTGLPATILPVDETVVIPPDAPTDLTATAEGSTQINLSWTAPASDGGSAITGYRIEVSTDGSNWTDLVGDTGNDGTSYSHTGLAAGDTRHYRVSAINAAGTSDPSDAVSTNTETPTVVTISATPVAPATDEDFELSANRVLRFAANATASTGTVTIRTVDDDVAEPTDVVRVSGAVSNAAIPDPDDVTVSIVNDDPEAFDLAVSAPAAVDEDAGAAVVTVTLTTLKNTAPTADIGMFYRVERGGTATRGGGAFVHDRHRRRQPGRGGRDDRVRGPNL